MDATPASSESGSPGKPPNFRRLDADEIVATVVRLRARIKSRFPRANLLNVCGELEQIAREARRRSVLIARPNPWLRWPVVAVIVLLVVALMLSLAMVPIDFGEMNLKDAVELLEAGLNDIVLIGAAVAFLVTAESRLKRQRAIRAVDELRAVAQVIDMHQLTKDPDRAFNRGQRTAASPESRLTPFELTRYLDYCSEMLSLTAKVASLYAQELDDSAVHSAVSEVETLCTSLSRKIWQKIMIVYRMEELAGQQAD